MESIRPELLSLYLLCATRLAGVLLGSPLLGFASIPAFIRVAMVVALTTILMTGYAMEDAGVVIGTAGFLVAMMAEFILGLALGFGIRAAIGALQFSGRVLDFQAGFGIANLLDPTSNTQGPLLGSLLAGLAGVIFLSLQGHHALIQLLHGTLVSMPLGQGALASIDVQGLLQRFAALFSLGFAVVSPALLGLALIDTAIAISARSMPQVNIYFVALPLKAFAGVAFFSLTLPYAVESMVQMFAIAVAGI